MFSSAMQPSCTAAGARDPRDAAPTPSSSVSSLPPPGAAIGAAAAPAIAPSGAPALASPPQPFRAAEPSLAARRATRSLLQSLAHGARPNVISPDSSRADAPSDLLAPITTTPSGPPAGTRLASFAFSSHSRRRVSQDLVAHAHAYATAPAGLQNPTAPPLLPRSQSFHPGTSANAMHSPSSTMPLSTSTASSATYTGWPTPYIMGDRSSSSAAPAVVAPVLTRPHSMSSLPSMSSPAPAQRHHHHQHQHPAYHQFSALELDSAATLSRLSLSATHSPPLPTPTAAQYHQRHASPSSRPRDQRRWSDPYSRSPHHGHASVPMPAAVVVKSEATYSTPGSADLPSIEAVTGSQQPPAADVVPTDVAILPQQHAQHQQHQQLSHPAVGGFHTTNPFAAAVAAQLPAPAPTGPRCATLGPTVVTTAGLRQRIRPPQPYPYIIAECILAAPDRRLTLRDLYNAIEKRYPAFYGPTSGNANGTAGATSWQNTVRFNLSRSGIFIKHEPTVVAAASSAAAAAAATASAQAAGVSSDPVAVVVKSPAGAPRKLGPGRRCSYWSLSPEWEQRIAREGMYLLLKIGDARKSRRLAAAEAAAAAAAAATTDESSSTAAAATDPAVPEFTMAEVNEAASRAASRSMDSSAPSLSSGGSGTSASPSPPPQPLEYTAASAAPVWAPVPAPSVAPAAESGFYYHPPSSSTPKPASVAVLQHPPLARSSSAPNMTGRHSVPDKRLQLSWLLN
ncbi:hypothetical protein H9P43_000444 [Blastocladiella emersonii ATCC 22665]|nr:hypothetical protein H9P43_000444 [Blastocladiella emersonii ATCC 22665]